MERFIILLRGINVSGKNTIAMPQLKKELLFQGFSNVKTLLNSGNIVVDSDMSQKQVVEMVHSLIENRFGLDIPVFVTSSDQIKDALEHAPKWWGTDNKEIYDNLIFVFPQSTGKEIAESIGEATKDIEQVEVYQNVIYWSFILGKHSKANWWKKTAMDGIREYLTIRTANTTRKLLQLANKE